MGICSVIYIKDRYLIWSTTAPKIIESAAHFILFQFSAGFTWLHDIKLRPLNLPSKLLFYLFLHLLLHFYLSLYLSMLYNFPVCWLLTWDTWCTSKATEHLLEFTFFQCNEHIFLQLHIHCLSIQAVSLTRTTVLLCAKRHTLYKQNFQCIQNPGVNFFKQMLHT